MSVDNQNINTIQLKCFDGIYEYKVEHANFSITKLDGNNILTILIESNQDSLLPNDNEVKLEGFPTFEIQCILTDEEVSKIGTLSKTIPEIGENPRGNFGNFYFFEHETPTNVTIDFSEVTDSSAKIALKLNVTDLNYYDGSKPLSEITVQCIAKNCGDNKVSEWTEA